VKLVAVIGDLEGSLWPACGDLVGWKIAINSFPSRRLSLDLEALAKKGRAEIFFKP
jgi:hypothetical protein